MNEEQAKQLAETHERVKHLWGYLYGENGHKGDIPEMKADIETALAQCEEQRDTMNKLKGAIAGAAIAGGGLGAGLTRLLGLF